MKNIYVAALVLISTSALYAQDYLNSAENYSSELTNHFSQFEKSEITYLALRQNFESLPEDLLQESLDTLRQAEEDLAKVKRGEYSQEEIESRNMSQETLEAMIAEHQRFINNEPEECIFKFAQMGNRIRLSFVLESRPDLTNICYFDGKSEILYTPEINRLRIFPTNGNSWVNFRQSARFGSGMLPFLGSRTEISSIDPDAKTFILKDRLVQNDFHVKFYLLESDPMYWQACEQIVNDSVVHRIDCQDFQTFNGLKIPQYVVCSKRTENGFHDYLKLTLVDAKINEECDFDQSYFKPQTTENMDVMVMNRR